MSEPRKVVKKKWIIFNLELAEFYAKASKDPSSQVGAVAAIGNRQLSHGYNGFPPGIEDTEERLNDRSLKYPLTKHAEANACLNRQGSLRGAIMYVSPVLPCVECSCDMIAVGIAAVVFRKPDPHHPTREEWLGRFMLAKEILDEKGIDIYEVDEDDIIRPLVPGKEYELVATEDMAKHQRSYKGLTEIYY